MLGSSDLYPRTEDSFTWWRKQNQLPKRNFLLKTQTMRESTVYVSSVTHLHPTMGLTTEDSDFDFLAGERDLI
jgi:hypothetical protein